jgi:hypothetical protein
MFVEFFFSSSRQIPEIKCNRDQELIARGFPDGGYADITSRNSYYRGDYSKGKMLGKVIAVINVLTIRQKT